MSETISEQEAALYDRQIRLWGLEAQRRLKNAKILFIYFPPVSQEIAKNIILAGVDEITVFDDHIVNEKDIKSSFLLDSRHLGMQRSEGCLSNLQALNPLVKVSKISSTEESLLASIDLHTLDFIVYSPEYLENVNNKALVDSLSKKIREDRTYLTCLMAIYITGYHSFSLVDLNDRFESQKPQQYSEADGEKTLHQFTLREMKFPNLSQVLSEEKILKVPRYNRSFYIVDLAVIKFIEEHKRYPSTEDVDIMRELCESLITVSNVPISVDMDQLKECCKPTIAPINAIVGGIMAQEIIKNVSKANEPFGNYFFFDSTKNHYSAHSIDVEG